MFPFWTDLVQVSMAELAAGLTGFVVLVNYLLGRTA